MTELREVARIEESFVAEEGGEDGKSEKSGVVCDSKVGEGSRQRRHAAHGG